MRKYHGTAIGEERSSEGDGWIEVLPYVDITVIECCGEDLEEELVWFRDRRRNVFIQCESMVVLGRRNGNRFRHGEDVGYDILFDNWSRYYALRIGDIYTILRSKSHVVTFRERLKQEDSSTSDPFKV